jgi:ribosomal protein L16 Arg81 hydroxylase
MFRIQALAVAAALCAAAAPAALAQTQQTPAKSQAKPPSIVMPASPAPKNVTKSLGGKGVPSGKMLTREELRTCLKQLDDVNAAGKDLQQRRTALDGEKDELVNSGEALKAMRAEVETKLAAVREWEGRMRAHAAEIETFNQRTKAAEAAPRKEREELAKALEADRERLNQVRASLTGDEARLVPAYESGVRSYNERALARDAVVADWNARNKALNDSSTKVEDNRTVWLTECANRPYREDDEIAIKSGK